MPPTFMSPSARHMLRYLICAYLMRPNEVDDDDDSRGGHHHRYFLARATAVRCTWLWPIAPENIGLDFDEV